MRTIAESRMLLRAHAELPAGLKVTTDAFREGWNMARTTNADQLQRKTLTRGWAFVKSADSLTQGGVGETPQLAIASAVLLALRNVGKHFNAAEISRIKFTRYPWFIVASVRLCPCIIQQNTARPVYDKAALLCAAPLPNRAAPTSLELNFGCSMPQLRKMLSVPMDFGQAKDECHVPNCSALQTPSA
jgi:hypothetical protein